MGKNARAKAVAQSASLYSCRPGDVIHTPRGEVLYQEPNLIFPGWQSMAFMLSGVPVGVIIFRPGTETKLRYCDREGIVHSETVPGDGMDTQMRAGMQRMAALIKEFLGERHPLADAVSANSRPA